MGDDGGDGRQRAAAGATWWIESDWEGGSVESVRRRIEAGPPRPAEE